MWKDPTDILIKKHRSELKRLNQKASKVVCALIQLGHYGFEVKINEEDIVTEPIIRISKLPFDSPYHHIEIYPDGYIGFYDILDHVQFESNTRISLSVIKKDILGKLYGK